jgi:hypothetical protein
MAHVLHWRGGGPFVDGKGITGGVSVDAMLTAAWKTAARTTSDSCMVTLLVKWPMFYTGEEVGLSLMAHLPSQKTVYPLLGKPHESRVE